MRIGLYNLEPKINNSAMMQVSAYHKQLGDDIYIYIAHCFMIGMIKSMLLVCLISHRKLMFARI